MRFGKLHIRNFLPYRKASLDLSRPGLCLIDGRILDSDAFVSNGAGKSSIFEAIIWVLFGKTMKSNVRSDDVINNKAKRNCLVTLEIIVGNDVYKISRGRKHKHLKNKVTVELNGRGITEYSGTHTQEFLRANLGLDYKTFINSVIFGQETIERFSSASDSTRKAIFDEILALDYLDTARENTKAALDKLDSRLQNLQLEYGSVFGEVKALKQNLKELDELDSTVRIRKYKGLIDFIEKLESDENTISQLASSTIPHMDGSSDRISAAKKEVDRLVDERNSLPKSATSDIPWFKYEKKLIRIETLISSLNDKVSKFKSKVGMVCVECDQRIPEEHVSHQVKLIRRQLSELNKRRKKYKELVDKGLKDQRDKDRLLDERRAFLNRRIDRAKETYLEERNQYELRKDRLKTLRGLIRSTTYDLITLLQNSAEVYSGTELRTKLRRRIRLYELELRDLDETMLNIDLEMDYYNFWYKAFSNDGIKSLVLDSVIPFLNDRAALYSGILTDGELEIIFDTQRELKSGEVRDKFDVRCRKVSGGHTYGLISAGEKRRSDLIQSLALRDLVSKFSGTPVEFLFLDECFDGLDDKGVDRVYRLLEIMLQESRTIFVATHKSELKGIFTDSILITNKGGEAKIGNQ